ncbi:hypothetical protein CesoFtcFv8_005560 [Champsocephalus esox]|uniref:Uncharacterized protein n=1 Tax=Champsocephalus esox TaxID=159716 RepID=A0AAN8H9I0_9TELE|nr:hypothetical protein CesoFtcFv8_005560 [Champsocephalus esox]
MRREWTAFRCGCADVCWQALCRNTEKSARLSCPSEAWRTAGLTDRLWSRSGISSQDPDHSRERGLFTLQQTRAVSTTCTASVQ